MTKPERKENPMDPMLTELKQREQIADCTDLDGLSDALTSRSLGAYCGFDPTAASLHVGSLKPLAVLAAFARHGHRPILLIGGATGMIGDPSGRSDERNLLNIDELDRNRAGLREQMTRLMSRVEGSEPVIVDNRDWFSGMSMIDFLRDIGKHFPVSQMLAKKSVQSRIESESGVSFTEFSYQLLQAYDFWHLHRNFNCELQLGGTDQWGNITAGVDYMRRIDRSTGFGLVWPLLLKPDGGKFGKTATGNVWLDAEMTSPFAFHQFWVRSEDAMVRSLLLQFTQRSPEEIGRIMAIHETDRSRRKAQRILARDVTTWVHGPEQTTLVERAAGLLHGSNGSVFDGDALELLATEIPTLRLPAGELSGLTYEELAMHSELTKSLSEGRRLINSGGLYANGNRVAESGREVSVDRFLILRAGKRDHALVLKG